MNKEDAKRKRKQNAFLKALAESQGLISYACDKIHISRQTYYNWCEKYPDFAERADEISEATLDRVESKLLQAINDDNIAAIIFYLKTKGKKRGYIEQFDNNIITNPFEKLMKELPDEEDDE